MQQHRVSRVTGCNCRHGIVFNQDGTNNDQYNVLPSK